MAKFEKKDKTTQEQEKEVSKNGKKSNSNSRDNKKSANSGSSASSSTVQMNDAANIVFSNVPGTFTDIFDAVPDRTSGFTDDYLAGKHFTPAGVCSIAFTPTIGMCDKAEDPANVAMRRFFQVLTSANARTPSYGAPDPFLVMNALNSMYTLHYIGIRAFGCLQLFAAENRYYPESIFKAMGMDYDSFSSNMANLKVFLNQGVGKLSSFYLPKVVATFSDTAYLASNLFLENPDNIKSQLYVFRPAGFWTYDDKNGRNNFEQWGSPETPFTYEDYVKTYNTMFRILADSEDVGIIDADILRAFGSSELMSVPFVEASYLTVPVYNETLLANISNATIISTDEDYSRFIISQDVLKNSLIQKLDLAPYSSIKDSEGTAILPYAVKNSPMINSRNKDVSVQDVAGFCTFVSLYHWQNSTSGPKIVFDSMSTFVLLDAYIITKVMMIDDSPSEVEVVTKFTQDKIGNYIFESYDSAHGVGTIAVAEFNKMTRISQFDYHYPVSYIFIDPATKEQMTSLPLRDVDTYTTLKSDLVRNVHQALIMQSFGL